MTAPEMTAKAAELENEARQLREQARWMGEAEKIVTYDHSCIVFLNDRGFRMVSASHSSVNYAKEMAEFAGVNIAAALARAYAAGVAEAGKGEGTKAPPEDDPFDCQEFYELMQCYRIVPQNEQDRVCRAYGRVQDYCRRAAGIK